ncbi:UDP-N-acetylmuramoyl-tripeptide--D-alanyl-D-alanine ligase [Clostridium sp. AM58-1XD]|uniref:UDP-N-acetylmuramoyl-tripeptide--D-alanyl-D- alanine ligase n=1 Tax=Clostridium sp. AM58-1XD TaxID=2292307 RepID=UPI000E47DED4|nr:UDP-N-acetylmuramoyl-tripeptide--D-alanyl-D-alanine ligase [Clostridium sp. AM58-1XD]RGY99430.1 UDP-N-acetylmuramoyl-tripeptide--D-alanyl-D-alanine ligase [Clostridium sp. AM58-1XD]
MEQIRVKDILKATGGKLLFGEEETLLSRIKLDSRQVEEGDLFVPIIGEKVDAHRFLEQVIRSGAGAVFTSEHTGEEAEKAMVKLNGEGSCKTAWIGVPDTREALQAVGSYCRARLSIPVIGITGSVGKTTTREMVAAALSAGFQVFKTPGNSNSQVGVPITMSEICSSDEAAVIELGMSEPGELTKIARIARPTMALITNIGITHIEQLGSRENIYREKLTIQDGLEAGGILLLNGDDDLLKVTKARDGYRTIYYGTGKNCDYRAENINEEGGCPSFLAVYKDKKVPVQLQVLGSHNVLNAMAAIAAACEAGLSMEAAAESVGCFTGFKNRQQIYRNHGITVIDDTYNASPVSMKAGINVLCALKEGRRKIAVLADMKELGEDTVQFHREVGAYLAEQPVDVLITYGELAGEIAEGAAMEAGENGRLVIRRFSENERETMTAFLEGFLTAGDCVLLKGSNSMKLGTIAAQFAGKKNQVI